MELQTRASASGRFVARATAALLAALVLVGPSQTQNAVANGDTRTLSLYHAHTQESITVTFRRSGTYDRGALDKLNWFLRDWRKDEQTTMDPRLFDIVWATWREVGSTAPIRVVSAYRSPSTNAMLRRRSSAVAKQSQHMAGKAMDMHMPDVSMAKVREIGMRLQNGGVGYYPTAGTPFVHLDVGSVRSWPRMPRHQLERLFPDGKTVHLPADGTPLPGYEAALAQIQSRGGSAISFADVTSPRRSLWAALFGGEDEEVEVTTPRSRRTASNARQPAPQQVAALSAPSIDSGSVYAIAQPGVIQQPVAQPVVTQTRAPAPKPQPIEDAPKPAAEKAPEALKAAPLPPRRPDEAVFAALTQASVPVPPIRPAMVALAETPEPVAASSALQPASVPLPPMRPEPTALALAGSAGLDRSALPAAITAGTAPADLPAVTTAYAPVRVPAPPVRPIMTASTGPVVGAAAVPVAQPRRPATIHPVRLDQSGLASLVGHVALAVDRPRAPARVEVPSVRDSVGSGIAASRFGADSAAAAQGFSGTLSRPMHVGFTQNGQ